MSLYAPSDETHQPVLWFRGRAVYAAHFVVAVYVVSMVITSGALFLRSTSLANALLYDSTRVLAGQVWRIFTYGLLNPPSIWFAIDMVLIVWFGRELEKFFGRRLFLILFGTIYLVSPLVFTAIGTWTPIIYAGQTGALAIFVAFATLYPGAVMMFDILAKWVAIVLVAIQVLMGLAFHNWAGLIALVCTVAVAFGFVRFHQGALALPAFLRPGRRSKLRVLPDLEEERQATPRSEEADAMAEVDGLLDKIAKSGMGSLTAKERAKLEAARARLKRARSGPG